MHPLTLLVAAVGLNYARHKRGKSTICSTTRKAVPTPVAAVGMTWFLAWFLPHWWGPKLRGEA